MTKKLKIVARKSQEMEIVEEKWKITQDEYACSFIFLTRCEAMKMI